METADFTEFLRDLVADACEERGTPVEASDVSPVEADGTFLVETVEGGAFRVSVEQVSE